MSKVGQGRAPVSHTYNFSYSVGRDKENHGLMTACANSSQDLSQKYSTKKWTGRMTQVLASMRPWVQTLYRQKEMAIAPWVIIYVLFL
jgi:hypothetical protein